MKLRRRDIIKKRQQATYNRLRKTFMKNANIGLVAFASGSILTHLVEDTPMAQAMDDVNSQGFSKSQFLDLVSHSAQLIAGENDLYASVMIAQAALESGWGNSGLASAPNYNLFGIKGSYNNQTVELDTLEDDGTGNYYQIKDGFRKYNNYAESLKDYADLLTGNHDESNWRYSFYYGARRSQTNSYQDATAYLTGRYATDTSYAQKLNRIISENDLTRYDAKNKSTEKKSSQLVKKQPVVEVKKQSSTATNNKKTHQVQTGDTYWSIAKRYNVSLSELQALNNFATVIYSGQELKLPNSQQGTSNNTVQQVKLETKTYTVEAGDTYWAIARRHNISVSDLQKANGYAAVIYPGQQLDLPQTSSLSNVEESNGQKTDSIQESHYVVKPGDTMWRIARNHNIDLDELKRLNNTVSSMIQVGQTLQVTKPAPAEAAETVEEVVVANIDSVEEETEKETIVEGDFTQAPTSQEVVEEKVNRHTVQAGDTLYSIAKRNNLDVYQLIETNGSTLIMPGQEIEW